MHQQVVCRDVEPLERLRSSQDERVIAVRGGLYLSLLFVFTKVAILYAVAYMIMVTALRFMDSLQHDYGYHVTLFSRTPGTRKGDLVFEQEHTFSNPHSLRYERLNWLTLNFGFHNAHHAQPTTAWWQLPALHRELFGDAPELAIPLAPQLAVFHRHRVARVLGGGEDEGSDPSEAWGRGFLEAAREGRVTGGNAASFLTSF